VSKKTQVPVVGKSDGRGGTVKPHLTTVNVAEASPAPSPGVQVPPVPFGGASADGGDSVQGNLEQLSTAFRASRHVCDAGCWAYMLRAGMDENTQECDPFAARAAAEAELDEY
jgi:hypothetical protein